MAPTTSDNPQPGRTSYVLRRMAYEPPLQQQQQQQQQQQAQVRVPARPVPAPVEAGAVPVEVGVDRATRERIVRLVAVLLELLDGRRSGAAAAGMATPSVARYLRTFAVRRVASVSRVLSVHVQAPHPGAVEVAAVCVIDRAVRAVALRVERDEHPFDGRGWRVTALRVLR